MTPRVYLDSFLSKEEGGGMQDVRGMGGVMVGVGGVVVGFDHLEPCPKSSFRAA